VNRRALVLAILVYVTLDLSLPAMPGAFVFDSAGSVESVQGYRGRAAGDVVVAPPVASSSVAPALREVPMTPELARAKEIPPPISPVTARLPRATLDSTPSAEDPHPDSHPR
jgi:hypothetical protein